MYGVTRAMYHHCGYNMYWLTLDIRSLSALSTFDKLQVELELRNPEVI